MIFPEFVLFYPLYCGNIADTKAAKDNAHDVDMWIEGSQAQLKNVTNRYDIITNLLVLGAGDKYTKSGVDCRYTMSGVDCVCTLVSERGLL